MNIIITTIRMANQSENLMNPFQVDILICQQNSKGMSSQIDLFLKTINNIQDEVINVALINKDKYDNLEEIITDVTYEMTYKILELMDGYYNKDLKYKLTEINSNEVVNSITSLHYLCEDYRFPNLIVIGD